MPRNHSILAFLAAGLPSLFVSIAQAQYTPVYGGPTFQAGTGGYTGTRFTSTGRTSVNQAGTAVTDANLIVGTKNMGRRAIVWGPTIGVVALQPIGTGGNGNASSHALFIGEDGAIVGDASKYNGTTFIGGRTVRWADPHSAPVELFDGHSRPMGMNQHGVVVGYSDVVAGGNATRWPVGGSQITALGDVGGNPAGNALGYAYGVNSSGTAVGGVAKFDAAGLQLGNTAVRWNAGQASGLELTIPIPGFVESGGIVAALEIGDDGTTAGIFYKDVSGQG